MIDSMSRDQKGLYRRGGKGTEVRMNRKSLNSRRKVHSAGFYPCPTTHFLATHYPQNYLQIIQFSAIS